MIPFNKPFVCGSEEAYIHKAIASGNMQGDFTERCEALLEKIATPAEVLLTQSCTAALEIAALLIDTQPGDEVIMPSFTFPSSANAFVLLGATPVFVDIREDTLNIDEQKIEAAITSKTKAILVVHYAGVACDMAAIMDIANRHELFVIEDAAQGLLATYDGHALGTIGHIGTYSFHATKNISCGEGGALVINDARMKERAQIIRDKGVNRKAFLKGLVKNYSWMDIGVSAALNEISAAYLLGQLENAEKITALRHALWQKYREILTDLQEKIRLPTIPSAVTHNAHCFYILLANERARENLKHQLQASGIETASHYQPLHNSHAGLRYGRTHGGLTHTTDISTRILRLPLWPTLPPDTAQRIHDQIKLA